MSKHHDALDRARWDKVRRRVLERDGQCRQCGSTEDLTVDHVVAMANGGDPYDEANLVVLCRRHNGEKSDRQLVRSTWRNPLWIDDVS